MDIRLTHDPDLPPQTVRIPLGIDRELWQAIADSRFIVIPCDHIEDDAIGVSTDIARELVVWERRERERN